MSSNGVSVESGRRYVENAYHWMEPKVKDYSKKATEVIAHHPIAAIAIAAGLGYFAARIWRK